MVGLLLFLILLAICWPLALIFLGAIIAFMGAIICFIIEYWWVYAICFIVYLIIISQNK